MNYLPWWCPLHLPSVILWRRDLIENEEIEIDNTDEAREGEHCYICEKMLRKGWKSNKHFDGRHLLLAILDQMNKLSFPLSI